MGTNTHLARADDGHLQFGDHGHLVVGCCCNCEDCDCPDQTVNYSITYTPCGGAGPNGCGPMGDQSGTLSRTSANPCVYEDDPAAANEWKITVSCIALTKDWQTTIGDSLIPPQCSGGVTDSGYDCIDGKPNGTVVIPIIDPVEGACNSATVVLS